MRGRSGKVVERLEKGDRVGDGSGAVARRGVIGRGTVISVGRAGSGLIVAWSRSMLGGFMMMGGSVTRGTILVFLRRRQADLQS